MPESNQQNTNAPADDRDTQLILRAKAGDREALSELLELHLPGLEAFVRLRIGRSFSQREGASDVLQSACREVVNGVQGFDYGGLVGFRKWLYTIAARKVADKFEFHNAQRRDIGREASPGRAGSGTAGDGPSNRASSIIAQLSGSLASPSQAAQGAELLERLEAALESLDEDERDVVLLSRVARLPRAEVAATMGRTEGAVRNLLHRTLVKLSALLES